MSPVSTVRPHDPGGYDESPDFSGEGPVPAVSPRESVDPTMRYVSHLACPTCGATYPADRVMNLCEADGRPVQVVLDLDRLKAERGPDRFWTPDRPSLWRFGGLLPLDPDDPEDRRHVVSLGEGHTPEVPYLHPWADRLRARFF